MQKKKHINLIVYLVVAILLLSTTGVYARSFTDVAKDHWAYEYVEKMNKKGIITGYPDATFKPNVEVTTVQALVMISRLLDVDSVEEYRVLNKYNSFLNSIGEDREWAKKGIALSVSAGIIEEKAVKELYKNSKDRVARKDEICVYLTRAMGLEDEAKKNRLIVLPFKDSESIKSTLQKYVKAMIDVGVINKKGDSQGKFNPGSPMNRAMMAKVLSVAYDHNNKNNVDIDIEEPKDNNDKKKNDDNEKETEKIEGTIISAYDMSGDLYVTIETDDDKKVYRINNDTNIKVDGKKARDNDITENMKVKAEVDKEYVAHSIEARSIEMEYSGEVYDVSYSGDELTIEYEDDKDEKRKTFEVDNDADIELDGDDVKLKDLKEKDLVEIKVENNIIVKIEARSKFREKEGTIKEIDSDSSPTITIEDEDGNEFRYKVDKDADIERDRREVDLDDLRIGDEIELEIELSEVKDIEAYPVEGEDEGIIKAVVITDHPEITIKNEDGKEVTYKISRNTIIEIDDDPAEIYDLRNGYSVELETKSNEVVYLEAKEMVYADKYEGVIDYINEKKGRINIDVTKPESEKGDLLEIEITDDTLFIGTDGSQIDFDDLGKDDEIQVMGEFDRGSFEAKSIIVTKKVR